MSSLTILSSTTSLTPRAMPDITAEFRQAVTRIAQAQPSAKKQPPRHDILPPPKRNPRTVKDEFMKEAYRIASHISSLKTFLLSIRRAYLNTARAARKNPAASNRPIDANNMLMSAEGITHLTDKERDEIDLQARMIITRCMDRIKELEAAENGVTSIRPQSLLEEPTLQTLCYGRCSTRARHPSRPSQWCNMVTEHTADGSVENTEGTTGDEGHEGNGEKPKVRGLSVIKSMVLFMLHKADTRLHLRLIADASPTLPCSLLYKSPSTSKSPQPASTSSTPSSSRQSPIQRLFDDGAPPTNLVEEEQDEEDKTFEEHLSPQQLQMLEAENAEMMKELEGTLEQVKWVYLLVHDMDTDESSVRSAEKALLEIATLQSQLSTHLAAQTQQTDKLHAEAVATTERIAEGNTQLNQARQRNASTRKWVFVFLMIASAVVLFLDWYD
ncbi:hypothetical protein BC938DRAFT_471726 [Jimgerdemannia flammicorona]|uniref:SNARE-complex protein Syntaxin-18 N-terminal domain-containing protein n=1 Tax=Jimgerdemannia flammicorona TaxID=994334 RepID=A0A433Q7K3_9FUNG|nr:hypothetical protein BC938DRAFT_471726 [Jimgerdemannia flammicorona]